MKTVATNGRTFRTFLLMQQFEAAAIGARIAQARREQGAMTQEQLAELLDVSTRAVQDYEAGVRIPWKHFKRLETIFSKNLEWFLHGEAEESPEDDRIGEILSVVYDTERKVDLLLEAVIRLLSLQAGAEADEGEVVAARVLELARSRQERATG